LEGKTSDHCGIFHIIAIHSLNSTLLIHFTHELQKPNINTVNLDARTIRMYNWPITLRELNRNLENRLKPFEQDTQDSTPNSSQRKHGIIDEDASKLVSSCHVSDALHKRNESLNETVDHAMQKRYN
jgi:hypothetical protein